MAQNTSVAWTAKQTGTEGAPIALGPITGQWLRLTIGHIPLGAVLSDVAGHSFTALSNEASVDVTGWDLGALSIVTASAADFTLVARTNGGASASDQIKVAPAPAVMTWGAASGVEGDAIALAGLAAQLVGRGDKLASLMIGGISPGFRLRDGAGHSFTGERGNTTAEATGWSLGTLVLQGPADANVILTATAVVEDSDGQTARTSVTAAVTIRPLAPAVTWAPAASGLAGAPVVLGALAVQARALKLDGTGNTIASIVVGGVPAGVTLADNAGHSFTAPGPAGAVGPSVDVFGWNLAALRLVAPDSGVVTLSVVVTERDAEGDTSAMTMNEVVTVSPSGVPVNHAPVVSGALGVTASEDGAVVSVNALANASDVDAGAVLSVVGVPAGLPAGVTYSAATHSFSIDPANAAYQALAVGQTAVVTVAYGISDGIATTSASVAFTITGTNDAPVVSGSVNGAASEGGAVVSVNALANASDADAGAVLSVVGVPAALPDGVSFDAASGSFSLDPANVAYQALAAGETAVVTVAYGVSDGIATTAASVAFTVTGTNDAPVVSGAVLGTANEDGAVVSVNALANASDVDAGAVLAVVGVPAALPDGVSFDAATGSFSLDPANAAYQALAAGETAVVTVAYGVSDGIATTAASVSFTVTGTNDAPVVSGAVQAGVMVGDAPVALDALGNAYDVDNGAALVAVNVPAALPGGVTYDAATNSFAFDPNNAAYQALGLGQTQVVTVNYGVTDGIDTTAASVAFTVTGIYVPPVLNAPPVFVSAAFGGDVFDTIDANSYGWAGGALNAVDPNGDAVTYGFAPGETGIGQYGVLTLDGAGNWSYDAAGANFDGLADGQTASESFVVTADDGLGGVTPQTLSFNLVGSNDAPVFTSATDVNVTPGSSLVATLAASDADGPNPLTYSIVPTSYDAALFSVVGDQLMFVNPPADANGAVLTYYVDVAASDGIDTTVQSMWITQQPGVPAVFNIIDPTQVATQAGAITSAIMASTAGITVDTTSLTMTAGASSAMFYDGSLAGLGIGKGILITSGTAPNTSNTITYFGQDNNMSGDPALDAVVNTVFNTVSYDATSITFSFNVSDPSISAISMDVMFGSDEYPEWVDAFVDIGVVLVNGTNVAYFNNDPLAPLSVIGSNLANSYFRDNTGNLDIYGTAIPGVTSTLPIEYDGVSAPLKIYAPVHAGVNTIEIGIADTGDHVYDSGLFIANIAASNAPTSGVSVVAPCTAGADTVTGTVLSESFDGQTGNDWINGAGGNDVILGGAGDDTLLGGDGNDFLDGGTGINAVHGDAGDDVIQHKLGLGVDLIDGGADTNTLYLDLSGAIAGQSVNIADGVLSDGTTFVNIGALSAVGGGFGDTLTGGAAADTLNGGGGDDTLCGGGGNDSLIGGVGNDIAVFSGNAADYAVTNIGIELYLVRDLRVGAPDGSDTLNGIERMQFVDRNVLLTSQVATGVTIQGTAADEVFNTTQSIAGQPLATDNGDVIHGGGGDDQITGGAGADRLYGDTGNDKINGGAGNDVIVGGAGEDEMTGGLGADTFAFLASTDAPILAVGRDQITDFRQAQGDKIDLSAIPGLSLVADFTAMAGQVIAKVSGEGYLVQGDINGNGVADFQFYVATKAALVVSDFKW